MSNDTPTGPPTNDPQRDEPQRNEPDDATVPDDANVSDGSDETPTQIQDAAPVAPADDTPTERFDANADADADPDAATKILPTHDPVTPNTYVPPIQPAPPAPPATAATTALPTPHPTGTTPPGDTTPPKKNHTLLYWLIGIGAVLLIAVIVLLVMLFSNDGDNAPEPTADPTPSATPTEEPSPTPEPTEEPTPTPTVEPPVASPTFATFSAPTSANCEEGADEAPLTFSWSSSDAVKAFLGVGTQNAAINPTVSDLPPTATYSDLPFDCSVASQVYTVTLEDELGSLASKTVTITR